MSDVWQGPGWWLASDGKWYPADAEPGALYDGDLPSDSSDPSIGAPPGATDSTVLDAPEPATAGFGAASMTAPPATMDPEIPTPSVPVEPISPPSLSFGSNPAPAETTEEPVAGGWQAIAPETAPVSPEPSIADGGEGDDEDGWTSAYEERQVVSDILGAAGETPEAAPGLKGLGGVATGLGVGAALSGLTPSPTAPEVTMPTVDPIPTAPEATIPTAPEVAMPTVDAIPQVDPIPAAPEVAMPTVDAIPQVDPIPTAPEVAMPTVDAIPQVDPIPAAPEVAMPTVDPIPPTGAVDTDATIRGAAWRTPNETPLRQEPIHPTNAPSVVDLAVPQDRATPEEETSKRRLGPLLAGVLGLALLIGAAILISSLLSGGDDDTAAEAATPETTTTAAVPVEEVSADATTSVFELRAGDCIVGDIGSGQVTEVTKVECEEEHQFEVYREVLIDSSITTFDEGAISAYAEDVCRTSLEAYVPATDSRGLSFKFLQPTQDSWNQADEPDRVITCLLFDDDAPLLGRANGE